MEMMKKERRKQTNENVKHVERAIIIEARKKHQ